ncbi:hypothetical protein B6D60_07615 [candidate division KSB1 bacterium 4484_87]|nr:MAG: hypothetical protein B6D60_07615 [candidate division KSB1 bacterium 4484_87]
MSKTDVNISVPLESLISSIKKLKYKDQITLLELIEEQLEEKLIQRNPLIQKEIDEAREAYKSGNYVTLDEYKRRNRKRLS